MKQLLEISVPKFSLLAVLVKKPLLLAVTTVSLIPVAQVVSYEGVWYFLKWFFVADLATGLLASYYEWKKSDHKDRWFFGKGEGFSSNKAKMFGLKLIVYLNVPDMLIKLQTTLALKKFKYSTISDSEFELATIVVLLFCAIEGFSIFHENLPKCGLDIWKTIKKIIGFYKETKKEITE